VIDERPGSYDEIRVTVEDDEGQASGQLDAALNEGVRRWREEHGGLRSPGPSPMVWSGLGFPVSLMEPSDARSLIEEAIPRAKELAEARDTEERERAIARKRLASQIARHFGMRPG
jgi:hypothetical protein